MNVIHQEEVNKILWSTVEDFVGLWQVAWELNTIYPDNSHDLNRNIAMKIVKYFIDNELVELYYENWGKDNLTKIPINEAKSIINQDDFWSAPEMNEICVKAGSTSKGEKYYNEELNVDLTL